MTDHSYQIWVCPACDEQVGGALGMTYKAHIHNDRAVECERIEVLRKDQGAVEKCSRCGEGYPAPVELHHTEEECEANQRMEKPRPSEEQVERAAAVLSPYVGWHREDLIARAVLEAAGPWSGVKPLDREKIAKAVSEEIDLCARYAADIRRTVSDLMD